MLVLGLVIAATKANILDKNGIIAAVLLGLRRGFGGTGFYSANFLAYISQGHKV